METLATSNTFDVDVNGSAGPTYYRLAAAGGINLGGATLDVNVIASAGGYEYTISAAPAVALAASSRTCPTVACLLLVGALSHQLHSDRCHPQ